MAGTGASGSHDWLAKAGATLGNRKTVSMIALGFSAGLPFALLTGTINAWFSAAQVDLATIGVLSWIGLAYAFKFLWSPGVNLMPPFPFARFGRRRGWILLCQCVIAACIFVIASQEPGTGLGVMAMAAAVGAFASATQDMSIDTWRIEVADTATPIDLLSAVYQFGYRIAAFIGGAGALFLADTMPWNMVFGVGGAVMLLATIGALAAPEPELRDSADQNTKIASLASPHLRAAVVSAVMLAWAWAGIVLISFMVGAVTADTPPDAKAFTSTYGPIIVIATVIFPCVLAALIAHWRPTTSLLSGVTFPNFVLGATDRLFSAIVEPFIELMSRLKWAAVLVLVLILSYRLTDAVWGPFAYPFYLGELQYTNTEVALASKTFGVLMLVIGISLAAWALVRIGRMPSMLIGAVAAAVTNLLYADLANGSPGIDGFLSATGLGALGEGAGIDLRMLRLMTAIAGENVAAGFAGAVFVAYLSALANKLHGAVQFAVFSSLTMLIGTLGRGALGEMIKTDGYADVFVLTMWLGSIGVAACALEWFRQSRLRHAA
ncbi:MAG: beta-lactamase induction signal transducer [Alphaproteobacteria bacterium]|nr:beta-lactamase induction signal transducer [Alphaproteobacteria bacterium]